MKQSYFWLFCGLVMSLLMLTSASAFASEPLPWQMGFQPAVTPVMERITEFHNLLMYIVTGVAGLVFAVMIYIVLRFNSHVNPEPSKTTHNTLLEVVWTILPVVILIVISVPSLKLLYYMDRTETPEMTIKVTGYQWYWGYDYPDYDNLGFLSYMIPDKEINKDKGQKRLLSTDNQLVLPIDTNIQILVTAADVIHSFAVPSFGLKLDAVPGRINETWTRIEKTGTYYGQCSELCGKNHAFMPIEIRAVSKEDFKSWIEFAKTQYASYDAFKAQTIKLAKAGDSKQ